MNDLNMNRLPVPTWNQCGVNSAPKAAALPAVPADDWGEVNLAFTLPAGVGEAEEDFTTFAESGMGAETDAFFAGERQCPLGPHRGRGRGGKRPRPV